MALTILWVESDIGFYSHVAGLVAKRAPSLVFAWAANRRHAAEAMSVQCFNRFIVDLCSLDLVEDLRERGDKTPVILLSDELTFGLSRRVRALAAIDFLKKGVTDDLEGLIDVLEHGDVRRPGLAKAEDAYRDIARTLEAMPGKPAQHLERIERKILKRARDSEPTLTAAARKVGILRQTFVAKLKKINTT